MALSAMTVRCHRCVTGELYASVVSTNRVEGKKEMKKWFYKNEGRSGYMRGRGIATTILLCVLALGGGITGLVFGINGMQRMFTHESCVNWGIQNDRTSKFVSYQLFDYACVTKAYDGRWVSIDNPQQFIPLHVNTEGKP